MRIARGIVGLALAAAFMVGMGGGHADAARMKPVDPVTCARVQADYFAATGIHLTCDQVTYLWYAGMGR